VVGYAEKIAPAILENIWTTPKELKLCTPCGSAIPLLGMRISIALPDLENKNMGCHLKFNCREMTNKF
jgi:hypothetical protein